MQGVLAGFATIGIIIGLGFLLAQLRILDATAQGVLTRIAFYVASPALLVTVLGAHRCPAASLRQPDRLARQRRGGRDHRRATGPSALEARSWRNGHRRLLCGLRQRWQSRAADRCVRPGRCGADRTDVARPVADLATNRFGGARHDHPGTKPRRLPAPPATHPPQPAFPQPTCRGISRRIDLGSDGDQAAGRYQRASDSDRRHGCAIHAAGVRHLASARSATWRRRTTIQIAALVLVKLVVQPIVAFLIGAYALGLGRHDLLAVTVIAALPTAKTSSPSPCVTTGA